MPQPEKNIFADVDAVAAHAATETARVLTGRLEAGASPVLALTGGTAGVRTATALAGLDVPWADLDVYFGDERFLPAGDPERNDRQIDDALFSRLSTQPRIHRWPNREPGVLDDVDEAAAQLSDVVSLDSAEPFFDVHLLGMGGEGHINSIFPDTPAVAETDRAVVGVRDCPKPPPLRMTFTLPAVRRARHVFVVVAGEDKADAVARALSGTENETDLPVAGAVGLESTVFILDEAAASKL